MSKETKDEADKRTLDELQGLNEKPGESRPEKLRRSHKKAVEAHRRYIATDDPAYLRRERSATASHEIAVVGYLAQKKSAAQQDRVGKRKVDWQRLGETSHGEGLEDELRIGDDGLIYLREIFQLLINHYRVKENVSLNQDQIRRALNWYLKPRHNAN